MSERTEKPANKIPSQPPAREESQPSSIPPGVWAKLQAEVRELKAHNFQSREQVLAWLQSRGYEDGDRIVQRLRAGGEI